MFAKTVTCYKRKGFFAFQLQGPCLISMRMLILRPTHKVRHFADPIVCISFCDWLRRSKYVIQYAVHLILILCHFFPVHLFQMNVVRYAQGANNGKRKINKNRGLVCVLHDLAGFELQPWIRSRNFFWVRHSFIFHKEGVVRTCCTGTYNAVETSLSADALFGYERRLFL